MPTLAWGLECPGTRPELVEWEWVAEPVPLSSYRLGALVCHTDVSLWARYPGDRLPDLEGELELQERSLRQGPPHAGPQECPEWARIRGVIQRRQDEPSPRGKREGEGSVRTWWEMPELGEPPENWDIQ